MTLVTNKWQILFPWMQICTVWISPNIFTVPTSKKFYKRGKWKRQPFFDMLQLQKTTDMLHFSSKSFITLLIIRTRTRTHTHTHTHTRACTHARTHTLYSHSQEVYLEIKEINSSKMSKKDVVTNFGLLQGKRYALTKLFKNTMEFPKIVLWNQFTRVEIHKTS